MVAVKQDIDRCITALQQGGVIVYPTDTVWGIGCDATNATAVDKVFALKRRPAHKSMIVLLDDLAALEDYVLLPDSRILQQIAAFDRPTTVIYPVAKGLAHNALAADGSIGIRIVNDDFCREMIRGFGKPVLSTSANLSGMPTPSLFREIDPEVVHGADYTVYYRREEETVHAPSRIVKIGIDGALEVIRN